MRVETAEAGTPAFERWAARWFDPWFTAVDAGMRFGRSDPVVEHAPEQLTSLHRTIASERRFVLAAVGDDGVVAGGARVDLPQRDNPQLAWFELAVEPGRARQGYGTALLRAVADLAREHGRTRLMTELSRPWDVPAQDWPGSAFATARGFNLGLTDVRRDLPLPADDRRLAALEEAAAPLAAGYKFLSWTGPTPAADRERMAGLVARMSTDAPLGNLRYEAEEWDAARVLEFDDHQVALGRSWWSAVAVAPDGEWAGYTQLGWTPHEKDRLYQWDTLVVREHRGHRLGLLLKLATLRPAVAATPTATRVTTWNAASNAPMIAVNEAMGFRPVEWVEEWQADL